VVFEAPALEEWLGPKDVEPSSLDSQTKSYVDDCQMGSHHAVSRDCASLNFRCGRTTLASAGTRAMGECRCGKQQVLVALTVVASLESFGSSEKNQFRIESGMAEPAVPERELAVMEATLKASSLVVLS
jgi:hypothetical protein